MVSNLRYYVGVAILCGCSNRGEPQIQPGPKRGNVLKGVEGVKAPNHREGNNNLQAIHNKSGITRNKKGNMKSGFNNQQSKRFKPAS